MRQLIGTNDLGPINDLGGLLDPALRQIWEGIHWFEKGVQLAFFYTFARSKTSMALAFYDLREPKETVAYTQKGTRRNSWRYQVYGCLKNDTHLLSATHQWKQACLREKDDRIIEGQLTGLMVYMRAGSKPAFRDSFSWFGTQLSIWWPNNFPSKSDDLRVQTLSRRILYCE